jgi:hypothetical protein
VSAPAASAGALPVLRLAMPVGIPCPEDERAESPVSLYAQFDHYNPPIGPDGTPYEFVEALRDEAIETETPIGWSEVGGMKSVPIVFPPGGGYPPADWHPGRPLAIA